MSFRKKCDPYEGYPSWQKWRDAHQPELLDAGVPTAALESGRAWRLYALHGHLHDGSGHGNVDGFDRGQAERLVAVLERVAGGCSDTQCLIDILRRRLASGYYDVDSSGERA